ncbi:hypothetical protein L873DRAFT_1846115 [Choiromyces venosus 120613-1]|uniref:TPR-like protein n=1 Tax=Choiromyces venosus 120613-1 TaxID=1336337 RepID=A0A3N4JAJ2_9PEZI|nr:hypothetical protein L873DRAFT_1846115 [Choiromyces venosus 120613-1]
MDTGDDLFSQYEQTDNLGFLTQAIALSESAVTSMTLLHPNRAILSTKLCKMLGSKFEHTKDEVDLDMAWLESTHSRCKFPGAGLFRRYEKLGNVADLNEAIIEMEKAIEACHPGNSVWIDMLNIWSAMPVKRFKRLGDTDDLELAVGINEGIVRTRSGGLNQNFALANLGCMLMRRFERIGDLGDLQKAIKHGEEAIATTPRDDPNRAAFYLNLGSMFCRRFKRIGDFDDLQKAIESTEEALAATPPHHPHRATICNNLGTWFSTKFERIGDLEDLQKTIEHCEAAVATIPQDHPHRVILHVNLGNGFSMRFEKMGDLDDLQKAIKHCEAVLAATPPDHPERAGIYTSLARFFESRYSCTHPTEDFNQCLRLFLEAWNCRLSIPRDRIQVARRAAFLLYSCGRSHESSSILEEAIRLMPSVNLQLLERDDQQHILSELYGLALGEMPISLKLLELGRGIIMGLTIDSRSEVTDLKADHRFEFEQYHRLRVEINSPIDDTIRASDETQNQSRTSAISRRCDAFKEMEEVLTRIRSLPGYGGFLLPPSEEALMNIAKAGPIVVFNSTPHRSDAIIVTTTAITSLELPNLDYKETDDRMKKLASFGGSGVKRGKDNKEMEVLLKWLWDAAVGPVLERLESSSAILRSGADGNNLQRIWWIGVG